MQMRLEKLAEAWCRRAGRPKSDKEQLPLFIGCLIRVFLVADRATWDRATQSVVRQFALFAGLTR